MTGKNRFVRWACAGLAGAAFWSSSGGAILAQADRATPAKTALAIPATRTVATVNGEAIAYGQLEPLLRQAGEASPQMQDSQRRELQREALSLLIDDVLFSQFLRKHIPAPSSQEVHARMAELEAGLKQRKLTLAQMCKDNHQTEAEVRQNIAQLVQWSQFAHKNVSDAELQKYYGDYKDFFDRVRVRASHVYFRLTPTMTVSEKEAARNRLQAIRTQIATGQLEFATAAKQFSQCPSAQMGGDIGHFPRKFVVDEGFARVAFGMKTGEISDVVATEFGLHIIKVTGRDAGEPSDFGKIKEMVREVYLDDLKQNVLAKMRKEAKIDVNLP